METQVRRHREKVLADHGMSGWQVEDFTLRTPEQMADNPFMRFIGFNYPVRFYKDVVLVKTKPPLKQARALRRRHGLKAKSHNSSNVSLIQEEGHQEEIFTKIIKAHHVIDNVRLNFKQTLDNLVESESEISDFDIYQEYQSSVENNDVQHNRTKSLGIDSGFKRKKRLQSPPSEQMPAQVKNRARAMTRILENHQLPIKQHNNKDSKTKSQGDSISDAKTLADFLETLHLPTEVKDIVFSTLNYVIKRTKVLNRRMTHLAKFTRDQNLSQAHNIQAAIDKVKKERETVEDQVEFLDTRYRLMVGDQDKKIEAARKELQEFTHRMRAEYVDFFKNRGRIRSEITNIAKDIDQRTDSNRHDLQRLQV